MFNLLGVEQVSNGP